MSKIHKAILTQTAVSLLLNALKNDSTVTISHMGIGDANGESYIPVNEDTDLRNEVAEIEVNRIFIDPRNRNTILVEGLVPEDIGGFTIREISLKDKNKNRLAIASCPVIEKPNINSGSPLAVFLIVAIEINNTGLFNLSIDYSSAMATKIELQKTSSLIHNKIDNLEVDINWRFSYRIDKLQETIIEIQNKNDELQDKINQLMATGSTSS